ncbi:hypothetical protein TNCV_652521 [Trichonephila clavipes]|nr:hypothetical protein TNCV_652521 [Trichonephila clavipes]
MVYQTDGRWRILRKTSESKHSASIAGKVQAGIFPGILWVHSSLWEASWINTSMHLFLGYVHPYMRIISRPDDDINQQDSAKCHAAGCLRSWFEEHQDYFTVLPVQQTHLT